MINQRTLLWVFIAAVVLSLLAVLALRSRMTPAPGNGVVAAVLAGSRLLPEVTAKADALSKIEIERGDKKVTLRKVDGVWVAPDKADYPLDIERVRELVNGLARLEIQQAMTDRPERFGELGLAWPDEKKQAALVRLFADGEAPFVEVVVGNTKFNPPSVYLRRLADKQTYRGSGELRAEADAMRFVNATLIEVAVADIAAIDVLGAGAPLALRKDEKGMWSTQRLGVDAPLETPATEETGGDTPDAELVETSAGEESPSEGTVDAKANEAKTLLPELVSRLEFDDVRGVGDGLLGDVEAHASPPTIRYQVGDRTITIDVLEIDDALPGSSAAAARPRWIRISIGPSEPGLGELMKDKDALRASLETIATRTGVREFRLPSWRAGRLTTWLAPAPEKPLAP